jgi:hypothetical protein
MKLIKIIFTLMLILGLISPVNAMSNNDTFTVIEETSYLIDGVEYRIVKQKISETEFQYSIFYEDQIDVLTHNIVNDGFALNNKIVTKKPLSRAAVYPDFGSIRDEKGNLAVYEGYSTFTIDASTTIAGAAMITSITMAIAFNAAYLAISPVVQNIYDYSTSDLPGEVLGGVMTIYRFQYRSKYTMFNYYNSLYQYKHLWISQFALLWWSSKRYGPYHSGWSF